MKKYFLSAIGGLLAATLSFAQTSTARFETETDGSTNFTDNGVVFNIISHTGRFSIQTTYPGTGWSGTANDNVYIDNSGTTNGVDNTSLNSSFSIKTTSNLFKVNRFWIYLSAANFNNQNVIGTLTITGKLGTVTRFTQTKTTGFVTSTATSNGYTLIDLTNLNGQNYTNIVISELQITLGGAYAYAGLDAFTWVKDAAVLPVTFGSVNAAIRNNSLSVNWTTEKETANDHFEIEASVNGEQFTKLGTVASKAAQGDSDVVLSYEFTSTTTLPIAAISLAGLAFLPFGGMRRKKIWLAGLAILSIAAIAITGCSKQGDVVATHQNYYIRIAQVDKDGTKTYSKVVQVQQEH